MPRSQQIPMFAAQPLTEQDISQTTVLGSTVTLFQQYLLREGKSSHTLNAFTSDLQLFIDHADAQQQIGSVTTAMLNRFLDWLEHERGVPCSRKSYARRVTTLKVYFKWLHALDAIMVDPALAVLQRSGPAPLAEILNEDDIAAVLVHTASLRRGDKPDARPDLLFRLLIDTGIKKNEVMRLLPSDITPGDPPILLARQKDAQNVYKERRIALDPAWMPILREYLAQYTPKAEIFTCTSRNLEYILEDVGKVAGVAEKLSFEMLRWTCAVRDYQHGIDPDAIREKLGLSKISWFETFNKIRRLAGETDADPADQDGASDAPSDDDR